MADPTIKPLNKFFLKKEIGVHHNGDRIFFMTHCPKNLSLEDARTLAYDLLALAGEPETTGQELVRVEDPAIALA